MNAGRAEVRGQRALGENARPPQRPEREPRKLRLRAALGTLVVALGMIVLLFAAYAAPQHAADERAAHDGVRLALHLAAFELSAGGSGPEATSEVEAILASLVSVDQIDGVLYRDRATGVQFTLGTTDDLLEGGASPLVNVPIVDPQTGVVRGDLSACSKPFPGPLAYVVGTPSVIGTFAAALVVALLLAVVVEFSLLQPIQRLVAGFEKVARGDLEAQVHVTSRDEFEQLGLCFNAMAHELREAQNDLKEHNRSLERAVVQRSADLQKAASELGTLDRMKGRMLDVATRGLREPLAAFGESLSSIQTRTEPGPQDQKDGAQLLQQADQLDTCISEIFELVHLEGGGVESRLQSPLEPAHRAVATPEEAR